MSNHEADTNNDVGSLAKPPRFARSTEDSLMATEIALVLKRCTGYRFRALFLVRGPTIAELSTQILDDILQA